MLLVFLFQANGAFAQPGANWRTFRSADGLRESSIVALSLSPRGNLLIKHAEAAEITVFDGYSTTNLPSPGRNNFRIHESRSGQLWSLHPEGIVVLDPETQRWVLHEIPEIAAENRADPLRQIRQISLLPADRDRAFFLLPDRLMEFNRVNARATLVRRAADTQLERFFEMAEFTDGSVWVTGARGLAQITGPTRRLAATTPWREFPIPARLEVENLQRPFEDGRGGVVAVGYAVRMPGQRVITHFDGGNWSRLPGIGETVRQAWRAWDNVTWAYTINSLLRFDPGRPGQFTREGQWVGQYKDVVTETNGTFWLGTAEGLVRYAPPLWRTPEPVADLRSLIHAGLADRPGRLWFAGTEGLLKLDGQRWTRIGWPDRLEVNFLPSDRLHRLPDGRIVIGADENSILLDPETGQLKPLTHPGAGKLRVLGRLQDGELAFQFTPDAGGPRRIERFDGTRFETWQVLPEAWNGPADFNALLATQNDAVWIGGSGGIALFRDGRFLSFGLFEGFRDERAYCFLELADGRIWAGGSDGIHEFTGKRWTKIRSGLERVTRLTRTRDGRIWAASHRGLHIYFNNFWMHHAPEEGLPSFAVADILEDDEGRLWAGTTRGLSRFHSDADSTPPRTDPATLSSIEAPSSEEEVTLLFRATDRWHNTPPERLLFSWRLDEGTWTPFTNTLAHNFERLGSGRHRIEVRSMDRNWNEDPASQILDFSVLVPWYREPRIIWVAAAGLVLALSFAALAINRHWQLVRSYAEVGRIVAVRTRELERANEELLHSQKMKALGTMAAGIAHDFNNILSIIKGSAQIIERNLEDKEKIRTRVSRIQLVVEQGSGIVKSMLGLSQAAEHRRKPCQPATFLAEMIRLLADRFGNEITFRLEAETDLPEIETVHDWLQQMLLNLILNAADAMGGSGEILLEARSTRQLPENLALPPAPSPSFVIMTVADSGVGMSPEVLSRIFEPFFSTKSLSTRRGTGLGLSMVYELAKELGCGLHVDSAPGKGTRFDIILPVRPSEKPPSHAPP